MKRPLLYYEPYTKNSPFLTHSLIHTPIYIKYINTNKQTKIPTMILELFKKPLIAAFITFILMHVCVRVRVYKQ